MNKFYEKLTDIGTFLVDQVLPAAVIVFIGLMLIRIVVRMVDKTLKNSKLEKAAHSLIKTVIRITLYGLLALIAASRLGIDVTSIVALASVLTLAVSLSVQNALTNLISGFTLLYTKPFSSGDYVEVAGQSGTVRSIGLTYTELTTPDNKNVFIPNSAVTSAEIVNYTVLGTRRVELEIAASYAAPIDKVVQALIKAATTPTILKDKPPFVAAKRFGDSAIYYVVQVWSASDDYWTTYFAITKRVKDIFDREGIPMTYPHLNVHLDQ